MSATTQGQIALLQKPPAMAVETISCNGSGDGTLVMGPFTGFLDSLFFAKGTFDDTADFTVTNTRTGEAIAGTPNLTASRVVRPRITPQGKTGTDLAALTVLERPFLFNDTITVVVAQGGASKTGTVSATIV